MKHIGISFSVSEMFQHGGRREGKMAVAALQIGHALDRKQSVVIAVPDQKKGMETWRQYFPGAMFTMVGDWGLRIHRKKK